MRIARLQTILATSLFAATGFTHTGWAQADVTNAELSGQLQSLQAQVESLAARLALYEGDGFGDAVDAHLMAQPDIIEQALTELEQQNIRSAIASVLQSPFSPVMGNPEGDVTIVEFFDYNCGFCRQMGSDLRDMIRDDPNLRVVLVELPILSEQSQDAAKISIGAFRSDPEKYEDFHFDLMLGGARIDGNLATNIATLHLFDVAEVKALSEDPLTQIAIQQNYGVMDALEITGTPALYVEGELFRGRVTREQLQASIARIREQKAS